MSNIERNVKPSIPEIFLLMSRTRNRLTNDQKNGIIAKLLEGLSIEDISKEIGIPESTIWSFRKRCIERDGDIENRKSPGRPKMSKKKREAIVECVKNNPFITKTWIAYELDLCPSSVGNVLRKKNSRPS